MIFLTKKELLKYEDELDDFKKNPTAYDLNSN